MTTTKQQAEKAEERGTIRFSCPEPEKLVALTDALAAVLEPGDVLLLQGELGAGKTTLTQHLAHALGVGADQYVSSPSFALLHEYSGRLPVYHMDLYRLGDEDDVEAAGLLDFIEQQGVAIIEWPDRLGSLMPEERLVIHIDILPDRTRQLTLEPWGDSWRQKLCRVTQQLTALKGR
jgi:tRNA threonylcarbamoyladenosine biosynthesis protein TsaE